MALDASLKMASAARTLTDAGVARIDQRLQQSSGGRRGPLLEPCHSLAERGSARLTVGYLELRQLHPLQQRIGRDADRLGGLIDVPLGKQRGDRLFLLSTEFSAGSFHAGGSGQLFTNSLQLQTVIRVMLLSDWGMAG
jgi:hypothetical protein